MSDMTFQNLEASMSMDEFSKTLDKMLDDPQYADIVQAAQDGKLWSEE